MSFKNNQYQQLNLEDRFLNQTARTQKIVRNSWAADFADIVFPAIDEERFAVLYSDNPATRPNTPINFIVGALVLKENNNLSDDELVESICCDIRFQYALHTTSFKEQPVSDRTFSRFRERLYNYQIQTKRDLLKEEFGSLNDVYEKYMSLHSNIRRMDSMMVAARCKRMSRLEIIYQTTANAVRLIHKLGQDELLSPELQHYLDSADYNKTIYYCKGEDVTSRLKTVLREASAVRKIMSGDGWHEFSEYQLLIRVLREQSDEDEDGNITPKDKKEISSRSLQNPSDPDATFRKKSGKDHKGYSGNIVETVGQTGNSLITDVSFEPNVHSDSEFCKEYIESRGEDAEPEILIADGAYSGRENQELAESKNTELVTTALTGKAPDSIFAKFQLSEDGHEVISCPMGNVPVKSTYYPKSDSCRVQFKKSCCANCPYKDQCHPREQSKTYVVVLSKNKVDRAKYMEKLSCDDYRALSQKRNAIEGVMSVFRRRYHVDAIPTYGLLRMRQFFIFKAFAYNFNKLHRYCERTRAKSAQMPEFA